MGPRGAYGFRYNNTDKVTYNHFDSYFSGLGKNICMFIKETPIDEMINIFNKIKLVDANKKATPKQIEHVKKIAPEIINLSVGDGSDFKKNSFYNLLRESQGNLNFYKKGLKYMIDNHNFLSDSLYCEWAYIINLDEKVLEVYCGFNTNPSAEGRYADLCNDDEKKYYGVKLVENISLDEIGKINDLDVFSEEKENAIMEKESANE